MRFHATPALEAQAMRRAAARAGCRVERIGVSTTFAGARAVGRVVCDDGWGAARLLLALALEDAQTEGARQIAADLRERYPSDRAFAEALQSYVHRHVRFEREVGEVFQGTDVTLEQGFGDCDDHGRAVYAIAAAAGIPAEMAFLHAGHGPTHAAAKLCPDGSCDWAETTIAAGFGEHPLDAAERLGVIKHRTDLARGVTVMTERDLLLPPPAGYEAANTPEDLAGDVAKLKRLGYLGADACVEDPADPAFREALQLFQGAAGIDDDGLTGPASRAALADAIGRLDGAAAVPVRLTGHLSRAFFQRVIAMAERMQARGAKVTAEDLLSVWLSESGIHARISSNLGAPFGGLNGMAAAHLKNLGFPGTYAEWLSLTEEEQLPYVERFYDGNVRAFARGDFGVLGDAGSLYLMNFLPALIAHASEPDFVLAFRASDAPAIDAPETEWAAYRKRGHYPQGEKTMWYAWNRGLDTRRRGRITVDDMSAAVEIAKARSRDYWSEVRARLASEGGASPKRNVAGIAGLVGLAAIVGGAIYEAIRG